MTYDNIDCIIGIDPGANGGIAIWTKNGVKTIKMPKDASEIKDCILSIEEATMPMVFIEKLSIRPDDIVMTDGKPSMGKIFRIQKMLQNFELLKATVEFLGIPYVLVHPMTWQSRLKLRRQAESKHERKARYKEEAQRLYKDVKVTLWNSDALLIMHFGRYAIVNERRWLNQNIPKRYA